MAMKPNEKPTSPQPSSEIQQTNKDPAPVQK